MITLTLTKRAGRKKYPSGSFCETVNLFNINFGKLTF